MPRSSNGQFAPHTISGMRLSALQNLKQQRNTLKSDIAQYMNEIRDAHFDASGLEGLLIGTIAYLKALLPQLKSLLAKFEIHREESATFVRAEQLAHNVRRIIKTPDPINTIFLALAFIVIEGGATGAMFTLEGKMGVAEGFSYGMVFAAINVAVGMFAGFFTLRYAFYKSKSPVQDPDNTRIRMAARVGFVICVLLLGMLILSAARVRAIGGHEHIFTFSEVSFLATFNDGLAIIIIVIGLLSSVIAIWKGYAGLSDPVPNLTAAFKYAVEGCNEKVSDLVESTIEALETRCDECLDTCEDALDLAQDAAQSVRDDVATLNDDIRDFNAQIDHEKAVLALYANESMAGYEQVYRSGDATPVNLGLEAFDELRLKLIDPDTVNDGAEQTESISKIKSLMSDVTTLKHDIITQIEASEAEYIAATPLISVLSKPQGV